MSSFVSDVTPFVKHVLSGTASSIVESPDSSWEGRNRNLFSFGQTGAQKTITEREQQAGADSLARVKEEEAQTAASQAALDAAAAAEAEKLRQRKGYKATILTGTSQDSLGGAPTGKAVMMG